MHSFFKFIERYEGLGASTEDIKMIEKEGLAPYYEANKFQLPRLVSAILCTDKTDDFNFKDRLQMLQWLMFEGDPVPVLKNLSAASVAQGGGGVCCAVLKKNDTAYRCRTCERNPHCVFCVSCFQNGNHEGHDFLTISSSGGCCDCGDVAVWKHCESFCYKHHKGAEHQIQQSLSKELVISIGVVLDLLFGYWIKSLTAVENLYHVRYTIDERAYKLRMEDYLISAVLRMLLDFCNCSESLLSLISEKVVMSDGLLGILVRAERFVKDTDTQWLQGLMFKLFSNRIFKLEFAKAFFCYYPTVVGEAVKECKDAVLKKYPLFWTFSFQILTVSALTLQLVKECNLLVMLLECLDNVFNTCAGRDGRLEVDKWANLCETTLGVLGDVWFVTSHLVVCEYVIRDRKDIVEMWIKLLGFVQGMDPLKRDTGKRKRNVHLPFDLGFSIANIHSLLVAGGGFYESSEEAEDNGNFLNNPRRAKVRRVPGENSCSSSAAVRNSGKIDSTSGVAIDNTIDLLCQPSASCFLTNECLKAIESWLRTEIEEASSVVSQSIWPEISYDVSSMEVSVHIPLHRLLSIIIEREARNCNLELCSSLDFFGNIFGDWHPCRFSAFLMEHPLRIRIFFAQVRAGILRKTTAILSCKWYREVDWYAENLDLDLFILQCCAAVAPADLFVTRFLERFGLSNYATLNTERSNVYDTALMQEMLNLIIQIVKERRFCGLSTTGCIKRQLIYKLAIGDATHSELIESLPSDLAEMDHFQEVLDTVAEYSVPPGMEQGIYKLRFEFWKKMDLYHPHWNSMDLQTAEERYLHFCQASAPTSQLPEWNNKIYGPFSGISKIATCKTVLQIISKVFFYGVYTDESIPSRRLDSLLLTALHLLSLALDICIKKKSEYCNKLIPILAFASKEILYVSHADNGSVEESLLSLLVAFLRKQRLDNFSETGRFDFSYLIESLLKKFVELDSGCRNKLQKLAPEVVS